MSGRNVSRTVGAAASITPAPSARTTKGTSRVAPAAGIATRDRSSVPAVSAPTRSARDVMSGASLGPISGAGLSARNASRAKPPSGTSTTPSATYGNTTTKRLRARRSERKARSGVRAPAAKKTTASAAAATPPRSGAELLAQRGDELGDGDADLPHRVALADRDLPILERLEIDRHAQRCADLVLPPVAPPDRLRLVVRRHEVRAYVCPDVARERGQLRLFRKRQHRHLVRGKMRFEAEQDADALLVRLLVVRGAHDRVRRAVRADRGLDDVRDEALVRGVVEVAQILARIFGVTPQVVVGPVVDALELFPAERELELDVRRRGGVVRALVGRV